jgi:predicted RNA-binding protein Jag
MAKRRQKHMKPSVINSKHTIHFGNEWVTITVRIPRSKFTERMIGRNGHHLKRLGLLPKLFR